METLLTDDSKEQNFMKIKQYRGLQCDEKEAIRQLKQNETKKNLKHLFQGP